MAYEDISNPESISTIIAGIIAFLAAALGVLKKSKGKTWKEILPMLLKQEVKVAKDIAQEGAEKTAEKEMLAAKGINPEPEEINAEKI